MLEPRILFVTSEFDDFVRVGGLAAVSAALPRALNSRCDVRVLLPGYPEVLQLAPGIEIVGHCQAFALLPPCSIGRLQTKDGLTVYVILCSELYEREGTPYTDSRGNDWNDNDIRFARLAACAVEISEGRIDPFWLADIVHANDWPSALVPAYFRWKGSNKPTILTIHNLAYQGLFPRETLARIGAPDAAFHIDGAEFHNQVSFLKAGIFYSTHLTTVSETYAKEITTPDSGCGLDGLLRGRAEQNELTGILNGIDESWDPRTCPELAHHFEAGDWRKRRANTEYIQRKFGLAVAKGPLFGLVSRLVHQKGVDLVLNAAEAIIAAGGQIVVTGNGERQFELGLQELKKRHPASVGLTDGFDPKAAPTIFAASDFTFMPSRFEPCGLSQMYAHRFGSLPIAYKTGGLAETIEDGKTGFLFDRPSIESFFGAICRAFARYSRRSEMNSMRRQAMSRSYSWRHSAGAYASLYEKLVA